MDIENSFKERYSLRDIFQSYAYQLKDFSRLIQPMVNFYEDKVKYIKQGCLLNENNQVAEILKENYADINKGVSVELIVNDIQPNVKTEGNSEEKMENEMSVKFMRIKEKKERKRINKYIIFGVLFMIILIIIILFT